MSSKKIPLSCVIDDDDVFVFTARKLMGKVGFSEECLFFENGKIAIDSLKEIAAQGKPLPQVILLDVNMPIMDGWQFLDEFIGYAEFDEIQVYVVSSSIDKHDILKAKSYAVVSDFLTKPLRKSDYLRVLQEVTACPH